MVMVMVRRSGNVDEKEEEEEEVMTGVEGDQHLLLLQLRGFLQGFIFTGVHQSPKKGVQP